LMAWRKRQFLPIFAPNSRRSQVLSAEDGLSLLLIIHVSIISQS